MINVSFNEDAKMGLELLNEFIVSSGFELFSISTAEQSCYDDHSVVASRVIVN